MKRLKDNSFLIAVCLFPFMLILSILKIIGMLKNSLYGYLIFAVGIVFVIAFIFALFFSLDEIINSDKKKRLIPLILVPIIYLPIYYTKYVYENEKFVGYASAFANCLLVVGLFFAVKGYVTKYMIIHELSNNSVSSYVNTIKGA